MNIAVFDIGTNSIHMLVAEIKPDLSFEVLEHEKDTTRLGDGSFESHHLNQAAVQRALEVIGEFHKVAKARRVKKYVAVATSAVRDARNGRKFVQEVYRRTGIRIKIVSGDEEGRLIELAARSNMKVRGKKTLVVDIGGGSMELILGDGKKYYYLKSFPLGVTRLTDRFLSKDPPSKKQLKRLEKHIEKTLARAAKKIRKWRVSAVIGTAGTMINLGSMVYERESARPLKLIHHYDLERRKLEEVHKELISLPLRKRLNYRGLDSKRADIIVAGSVLVRTLMLLLRIDQITISKKGIREGIVLDFIEHNRASLLRSLNGRIPGRRK